MFNGSSVKVSYTSTGDISQIISSHNKNTFKPNKIKNFHVIVDKENISRCNGDTETEMFFISAWNQHQLIPFEFILAYQKMNGKNGIIITQNHSQTTDIRMKYCLVATFRKLRRLDK